LIHDEKTFVDSTKYMHTANLLTISIAASLVILDLHAVVTVRLFFVDLASHGERSLHSSERQIVNKS